MYELMYYGGLILSITMGVVCIVLFVKLNMMEVIDYYFKINGKYGLHLEKLKPIKKKGSIPAESVDENKTQEIVADTTTLLNEDEMSLEAAKRYATTLLDDDYQELQQEDEFVLDGVIRSNPTTLL